MDVLAVRIHEFREKNLVYFPVHLNPRPQLLGKKMRYQHIEDLFAKLLGVKSHDAWRRMDANCGLVNNPPDTIK